MKHEKAIEILKSHNEWLHDYERLDTYTEGEVTEAIATAIAALTPKPPTRPFECPIPDGWEVKTRGGDEVKQLTRFDGCRYVDIFRGIIFGNILGWDESGNFYDKGASHERDLILARKRRTIWVVEWPDGLIVGTSVKADAEDEYNDAVRSDMHGGEPTIREVTI